MNIDQLMAGSIDLHVHCAPDGFEERRVDALQLAQQAIEYGMKHVVVKSHQFCSAPMAAMVNKAVNQPVLIGSLVLNDCAGGLNPEAVKVAAKEGAKIIWMPTTSARSHIEARSRRKDANNAQAAPQGISVIDKDGNLVPEVHQILDIIKAENLVLATGHISATEIIAIANEARKRGVKTILTHLITKGFGHTFPVETAVELAQKGAFVEFCFNLCLPPGRMTPADFVENIKILGADHCVLSTDLGQPQNPFPAEGFRMALTQMIRAGLSENEVEKLVKINPEKLLFSKSE